MDDEEKHSLRFACLELACKQTKINDEGNPCDLDADECVTYAETFYKFVTKMELN